MNYFISPTSLYTISFGLIALHTIIVGVSSLRQGVLSELETKREQIEKNEKLGRTTKDLIRGAIDKKRDGCELRVKQMLKNFERCIYLFGLNIVTILIYEVCLPDPCSLIPLLIILIIILILFWFWSQNTIHLIEINKIPYGLVETTKEIIFKAAYE